MENNEDDLKNVMNSSEENNAFQNFTTSNEGNNTFQNFTTSNEESNTFQNATSSSEGSNTFQNITRPSQEKNAYKTFEANKKQHSSKAGFGKTVVLPFFCGMLGTVIIAGISLTVPSIKQAIVRQLITTPDTSSSAGETNNSNNFLDLNTQLISLQDYSDTATGVAKKVQPSIVAITVEYSVNSIFSRVPTTGTAKGSGIIISEDGYILTNNHVVNSSSSSSNYFYEIGEANKVTVKLYDGTECEGTIIGTDSQTDLAVIKIDKDGLNAAELGSSSSVQVGEFAMAIGSPLGLDNSVTAGIISAVNREVTDSDGNKYVAIQTDAAINAGNSGGALVNSKGQVIGVNTLKLAGDDVEGVGFAIPIDSTKEIYEQLIEYNKVKRPFIGITGIDLTEDLAKKYNLASSTGVYVQVIEDFSAAQKAELKVGDIIIEVDGKKVKNMDEINEIKNAKKIGDTMTLKVYRDGKEKDITVTLQEQP